MPEPVVERPQAPLIKKEETPAPKPEPAPAPVPAPGAPAPEPTPESKPEPAKPGPEPAPAQVPSPAPVPAPVVAAPKPELSKPPAKPVKGLDPAKVDAAIARGVAFLQQDQPGGIELYRDLILYTLVHAGETRGAFFKAQLERSLKVGLSTTYDVALHAMTLSELQATQHQKRIAQCAQFLVDNQADEGGWSYGKETTYPEVTPVAPPKPAGTATRSSSTKKKPDPAPAKPPMLIRVKRQPLVLDRKPDNSNSQYAALGLRACLEANVVPPEDTLRRMKAWFESEVVETGGWGYSALSLGKNLKTTGTMSAGALGGLVIAKHYLREPWAADPKVVGGLKWLAATFTTDGNPGGDAGWLYYYLYGIERVGALTSVTRLGARDWYREGTDKILAAQQPDGSWTAGEKKGWTLTPVADTCFAILFLRRATRPLEDVATVDPFGAPRR